jgi:hypothetical protein
MASKLAVSAYSYSQRGVSMPKAFLYLIAAVINTAIILPVTMVVLGSAGSSSAQTTGQRIPRPAQVRVRAEPCWQKVGISKDVIDQRQAVELDTRSQVQAVCADSSLSDPQKKQKIRELRQESKQKVAGLMTEQQQQELQSCQKQRAANHPAPAGVQHAGGGPCANLASPSGNGAGAPQNPGGENQPQQ